MGLSTSKGDVEFEAAIRRTVSPIDAKKSIRRSLVAVYRLENGEEETIPYFLSVNPMDTIMTTIRGIPRFRSNTITKVVVLTRDSNPVRVLPEQYLWKHVEDSWTVRLEMPMRDRPQAVECVGDSHRENKQVRALALS